MKKKIGFVSMDSVLAQWLLEKLIQEPPESECAEDLLSGIHDMLSGEATSLLLSTSKEAESSLPPSDEIRIGALGNLSEEQESEDAGSGGFSYAEGV